eukprot:294415-Amorphochlora_amoeboformis.AAC.1
MGLPGSGKSTVKRQKIDMKGVVDIDPDRIKKRHPEWRIDNYSVSHGARAAITAPLGAQEQSNT